jgi:hypothetical protein
MVIPSRSVCRIHLRRRLSSPSPRLRIEPCFSAGTRPTARSMSSAIVARPRDRLNKNAAKGAANPEDGTSKSRGYLKGRTAGFQGFQRFQEFQRQGSVEGPCALSPQARHVLDASVWRWNTKTAAHSAVIEQTVESRPYLFRQIERQLRSLVTGTEMDTYTRNNGSSQHCFNCVSLLVVVIRVIQWRQVSNIKDVSIGQTRQACATPGDVCSTHSALACV